MSARFASLARGDDDHDSVMQSMQKKMMSLAEKPVVTRTSGQVVYLTGHGEQFEKEAGMLRVIDLPDS